MYHGSGGSTRRRESAFDCLVRPLGIAIASVLVISACSRAAIGEGPASSARTTTSAQSPGHWTTYSDSHGYTITYPSTWVDKGRIDNQGSHDFVSEKADGVYGMSEHGVWLGIWVTALDSNCLRHFTAGSVRSQTDIVVSGSHGIKMLVDSEFASVVVNVGHGDTCYGFVFTWKSSKARDAGTPLTNAIIGEIRLS